MKKIFLFSAVSFSLLGLAQSAETPALYIPQEFQDRKMNKYDLDVFLARELKKRQLTVLPADQFTWPDNFQQEPCAVYRAELTDTSSMFKNKVTVNLVDCHGKTIASSEGKSIYKDFEPGLKDAVSQAIKKLIIPQSVSAQAAAPKMPASTTKTETSRTAETAAVIPPTPTTPETKKVDQTVTSETYSNGQLTLNRIFISGNQFILVQNGSPVPYAIFQASPGKEVFHVKLQDGTSTLGYLKDNAIILDKPTGKGDYKQEIFKRQ